MVLFLSPILGIPKFLQSVPVGAKRSYADVVQGRHDKSSKKHDDVNCELYDAVCQPTVSGKK
jgi:hypothetical protein